MSTTALHVIELVKSLPNEDQEFVRATLARRRPIVDRDDELIHGLDPEIAADQFELRMRVAPPFPDVRLLQPVQHQRQVGRGHCLEDVARGCHNVSMVTLRLV